MSKEIHTQKHMTLSDRIFIEQALANHESFRETASVLKKDPSTISKEIPCSERTLYRYIDAGILSVKNIDLPRKVNTSPASRWILPKNYPGNHILKPASWKWIR